MPINQSTTVLCYHLRMKDISIGNHYESLKQSAYMYIYMCVCVCVFIILTIIVPRQIKSRIKENTCTNTFQNVNYFVIYQHIPLVASVEINDNSGRK
jgi:K+-transporting ATPase A subunit